MKPALLRSSVLALFVCAAPLAAGEVRAVPSAYATIQAAIDAANPGDTVLVADGTYKGIGNRDLNFGGKAIVVRSANGPAHTIIDAEGTPTEPYRGLVFNNGETRDSVLEGFTITGGATLPGAVIDTFNGGAILIQASSPTIRNCRFVANQCGCWGGAVYAGDFNGVGSGNASPLIENCLFDGNNADDEGGGFFTWGNSTGSQTIIRNSVFIGNGAAAGGGGVTSFGGTNLVLDHVTMVGNFAPTGANAFLGQATITNSILWADTGADFFEWSTNSVSYSVVRGGAPGRGNLDVNPRFEADGYHLSVHSPLIDAGQSLGGLVGGVDIDGQQRQLGQRTDIGADEVRQRVHREIQGSRSPRN